MRYHLQNLYSSKVEGWGFKFGGSSTLGYRSTPSGWTEVWNIGAPNVICLFKAGSNWSGAPDDTFDIDWSMHITKDEMVTARLADLDKEDEAFFAEYISSIQA